MDDGADTLELLDLEAGRVLAIVAHPDDLEFGAVAAVARWRAEGSDVTYVLATRGEAGIDGLPPEECGPLREAEQRASAAVVGVAEVEFLGFADGVLEHDVVLRRALAAAIRRHRPDTVLTLNHRETWGPPGALNSADHRALGGAVLDAVADAGNRWIFPEVGEPHSVRRALVASSPQARHAIDVSGHVDVAIASLAEHRAYLEGLGDHPMADPEVLRWWLGGVGARVDREAALAVELFDFA